ncbi:Wzz/FepE/Etk N-terminal domain-containing protein [Paenibacillus sp. LHD-117]|uniref:YveK family protein n=1 Tax=Paenibacillus sp. LHD-117 TaxID=3071412 RepID=UPI0027DF124E|nr:Wzz/FepE/Etk N-terminal domain-containing protein [Paenibacillus sp. LHD-117]MDQ6423278.1 Wzz/FepE/Etk N-terminal domain-containing protein [Paenibacillus sp. LHD-117]
MEISRVNKGFAPLKEKEINLKIVFHIIKKRLWLIVLLTGLLTALGILYNNRPEPQIYVSSTRVIIAASNDMMTTVRALVREPIVLNQVIEELQLDATPGQLRSQVRVDSVDSSLITVVSVLDTNPNRAADIANAIIEKYREVAMDTLGVQSIRLLTSAEPEPFPINTVSNTIVYVAFVIGLILSISLAFLLESLDESVRTEQDVESLLGLNMLGHVSRIKPRSAAQQSKKSKPAMIRSESIGS